MEIRKRKTINYNFGEKHKEYIRKCRTCAINVAEGAVRAGKTIDNVFAFAAELKTAPDRIHLVTGSTVGNAKLNIGDANGFGLEWIFRGQCHWGKYKDNEALIIKGPSTGNREKIVLFAGGAKQDSYKKIRGNSYGMWLATEINLHHDNTIKEANNRLLASKHLKIFWDLNPDNPKAPIYKEYIDNWKDKAAAGEMPEGYNYMHCTIYDNINIPEDRLREIESRYDPNSIWFMRDIKGIRIVANGLIYRSFANMVTSGSTAYLLQDKPQDIMEINIGVDFGGNGSGHSFTATAITRGYRLVVALASRWIDCKNGDITPAELEEAFLDFCRGVIAKYGYITRVYCDSAEQTLIAGLRAAARKNGFIWLQIDNAAKLAIHDRIQAVSSLMAQGRFFYMQGCDSLVNALCTCMWDPDKPTKNERLDDGSTDIDSCDSFEYSFERAIGLLLRY